MSDQARLIGCLDYIKFKCNTYPYRHGPAYCFVFRAGRLYHTRLWYVRPHDIVLYTFQDCEAVDIVLDHIDIQIAKAVVRIYNGKR